MRKVGTDTGNISAAFTNFNQEKEAQLLKEVEEEDRKAEEAGKKINAVLHAKKKKENERLQRRENMLALGMLEEDLNALGLGLIEIDDDPSLCTLVAKAWRKSSCRAGIIKATPVRSASYPRRRQCPCLHQLRSFWFCICQDHCS